VHVHEVDAPAPQGLPDVSGGGLPYGALRLPGEGFRERYFDEVAGGARSSPGNDDRLMAAADEGPIEDAQHLFGAAGCVQSDRRQRVPDLKDLQQSPNPPLADRARTTAFTDTPLISE